MTRPIFALAVPGVLAIIAMIIVLNTFPVVLELSVVQTYTLCFIPLAFRHPHDTGSALLPTSTIPFRYLGQAHQIPLSATLNDYPRVPVVRLKKTAQWYRPFYHCPYLPPPGVPPCCDA